MAKRVSKVPALRREIKNLQAAGCMNAELLRHQGRQLYRIKDELDTAKRIAGEMSILFPATQLAVNWPERSSHQMARLPPLLYSVNDFDPLSTVQTQNLSVMLGKVSREGLDQSTHVMIQFGTGRWGYAITDQSRHVTPPDVLVDYVTTALGRVIGNELAKRE